MNGSGRYGQVPNVVSLRPDTDPLVARNLLIRALRPYEEYPETAKERARLISAQQVARAEAGVGR